MRLRQRAAAGALLRDGFFHGAAGRGERALVADRPAGRRAACAGRRGGGRAAVPGGVGTGAGPARGAVALVPDPQGGRSGERRGYALAPDRAAASQHLVGDPRTDPRAVRQGRHRRSRDPCPQRGSHRPAEPAIAQFDGHHHDRGQPASDRRIPLPHGDRTEPGARPDPHRQSRLEPEEPGQDGGVAAAL